MERKLKIIGIYVGLLFFVSIMLILITSLSSSKMDPYYEVEENEIQQSSNFNGNMVQSVTQLTQTNQILNDKVNEQNNKIEELEKTLSEKDRIIKEYQDIYNEDTEKFYYALKLYAKEHTEQLKETLNEINRENLRDVDKSVYDVLLENLN